MPGIGSGVKESAVLHSRANETLAKMAALGLDIAGG